MRISRSRKYLSIDVTGELSLSYKERKATMPRAKRGNKRLERRKKILKLAKGYRGTKSKLYRSAKESVERGFEFRLHRSQAEEA